MQCELTWPTTITGEGRWAPMPLGASGSHHRRRMKKRDVLVSFPPCRIWRKLKSVNGRRQCTCLLPEDEWKVSTLRDAALKSIREEKIHCAAGSDDTGKKRWWWKNGKWRGYCAGTKNYYNDLLLMGHPYIGIGDYYYPCLISYLT
jgi:hypothetical protein